MDLRERHHGPGDGTRHPWEASRGRFFARLLGELVAARSVDAPVHRMLDVGAGDDWLGRSFLPVLRRYDPAATVTCWDVHYDAEDLALAMPDGVARTATTPAGTFELVTALDVLEHVEDEDGFLQRQVVAPLAAGGHAVISVPAYRSLYGDHDRMLGHHRRYRPAELRAMVGRHLEIVDRGSLFTSLLLPRAAQVGVERLGRHRPATGVGEWSGGPGVTRLIETALDADAAVSRRLHRAGLRVPGLSTWVIARSRP